MEEIIVTTDLVNEVKEPVLSKDSGIGVYMAGSDKGRLCFYIFDKINLYFLVVVPYDIGDCHSHSYISLDGIVKPLTDEERTLYPEEILGIENNLKQYQDYITKSQELDNISTIYYSGLKLYNNYTTHFLRELNKPFFDTVDYIQKLCEEVYFKDNITIIPSVENKRLDIYILYPEIVITNSNNRSHGIKDLVVKMSLTVSDRTDGKLGIKMNAKLKGTRLTLSDKEHYSHYRHSHLKARENYEFTEFCLGATDVSTIEHDLLNPNNGIFSETQFLLFLNLLESYVKWESLEGGPHITMDKVSSRRSSFDWTGSAVTALKSMMDNTIIDFNMNYDNGTLVVVRDEFLTENVSRALTSSNFAGLSERYFYCIVDASGSERDIRNENIMSESRLISAQRSMNDENCSEVTDLTFGNRPAGLKLYLTPEESVNKVLSSYVIVIVADTLQDKINNYYKEK